MAAADGTVTVSVIGACAPNYYDHLPGWLASVDALQRRPDDVVVCAPEGAPLPSWVRRVEPPMLGWAWAPWHNAAAFASTGEYVAHIGIDDRYYPHALDGCDAWTADVVVFGMDYDDSPGVFGAWIPDVATIAAGAHDYVPCGSPIRRAMFDRLGGWQDHLFPAIDWALWVGAARLGGTFERTGRIDFWYRAHDLTPQVSEAHRLAMLSWAASL